MIVRRCLTTALSICLSLCIHFGSVHGQRWSRQVSNSEWIPLANPRNQLRQTNTGNEGSPASGSSLSHISSLSLPPALQEQYQQQLLQLQKTQENIQKLLLLQQQLRAQQQILQSQGFLPTGFSNADGEKQVLHQSTINTNVQTVAELSPEVLVPPLPSSEAIPPVYPPQNFLPQGPSQFRPPANHGSQNLNNVHEGYSIAEDHQSQDYKESQTKHFSNSNDADKTEDVEEKAKNYIMKQKYRISTKRGKGHTRQGNSLPQSSNINENVKPDEEEEVQLVYVPLETLTQRGQSKRRGQKQYPPRQQQSQYHLNEDTEQATTGFPRNLLDQLEYLKEERLKEASRIEEEKERERKIFLEQQAFQEQQELERQREAEKKRQELERLEEITKQRELEKLREIREKQRLEELEKQRLAEIRIKEEKRREEEARQREIKRLVELEQQKQLEIQRNYEQQRNAEKQQEDVTTISSIVGQNHPRSQTLPLVRDQQSHRPHFSDISRPQKHRSRTRQRQKVHQDQTIHREFTTTTPAPTTPSPNQPPLSVYMGGDSFAPERVKISDVLRILKGAKTIAVLDTVGPNSPKVFVGPTSLEPPPGYTKFDLPYLSSIDHNRVERKVDKLPFFVAPLSFEPPPGYSKIPFPAPHIGSVVVNSLDGSSSHDDLSDHPNPNPTPLIEPNSYINGITSDRNRPHVTTPSYESPSTTSIYSQDVSSTPKYEAYSTVTTPTGSRFRFRQYYADNNSPSVIDTIYHGESSVGTKQKPYYEENFKTITPNPIDESGLTDTTAVPYQEEFGYSNTPSYQHQQEREDTSAKEHDLAAQLALINQELAQQRDINNKQSQTYQNLYAPSEPTLTNTYHSAIPTVDVNDVKTIDPAQYNLPAELPAISPHLPGLVNSLLDKQQTTEVSILPETLRTTKFTTTTTTTTTPRPSSTTYRTRTRHRGRIVPTRATTTSTPASVSKSTVEAPRRIYSRTRSGSRYTTTTTETYNESLYEPTKSKNLGTTQKYNYVDQHKRPRGQKHRNREKSNFQSENYNVQAHQAAFFEPTAVEESATQVPADSSYLQPSVPGLDPSKTTSNSKLDNNNSGFSQDNYPPTTIITPINNYPLIQEAALDQSPSVTSDDYLRGHNYPQNHDEKAINYHGNAEQSSGPEQSNLELAPINGFNYQAQNSDSIIHSNLQNNKDYTYYTDKSEAVDFELAATTESIKIRPNGERNQYLSHYEVADNTKLQQNYPTASERNFSRVEKDKIEQSKLLNADSEIFVPLPPDKQEDYNLQLPLTEQLPDEVATQVVTTTTTEAPVIIRQRVRGRSGGRVHSDSSVQTRPRGSQDEYVRFSAVNQDSVRSSSIHRQSSRTRSRTKPQSHVQTEGYDYVKVQGSAQRHRTIDGTTATTPTTTTTTTTTSTTTEEPLEDIDYGFIRPPSFQPVHPVDNRFHTPPVTFRPPLSQLHQQSFTAKDEAAIESQAPQTHLLKHRPKYHLTTNRRPSGKVSYVPSTTSSKTMSTISISTTTTTPIPITSTMSEMETTILPATINPDNAIYTVRPKSRTDEPRPNRNRGSRIRRPGRKRITTPTSSTTESILVAHNELPLDENYPRIAQPLVNPSIPRQEQQSRYNENFDGSPQFEQFYKPNEENYPQDFVLNFETPSRQTVPREEYDQTQLASNNMRKYRTKLTTSTDSHANAGDIYGAESQWSTKLTRTSFQPSFAANRLSRDRQETRIGEESVKDQPEIITAGPEISSATFVVSWDDRSQRKNERTSYKDDSDDGNTNDDNSTDSLEESMMKATTFGKKMTIQDHTERPNITDIIMNPSMIKANRQNSYHIAARPDRQGNNFSMEQLELADIEKIPKKNTDPVVVVRKTGLRRKRVKVRVRPVVDDFVTAESQHINAAVNSLAYEQYKYNPIRRTRPTDLPSVTSSTENIVQKSVLQDFLEEILKTDDVSLPVLATSTSTELPVDAWSTTRITTIAPTTTPLPITITMMPITTMPSLASIGENEGTTTIKDVHANSELPTTITTESQDFAIDNFGTTIGPTAYERKENLLKYYGTIEQEETRTTSRNPWDSIDVTMPEKKERKITQSSSNGMSNNDLNEMNDVSHFERTTERSSPTTKSLDFATKLYELSDNGRYASKSEGMDLKKQNNADGHPKNHREKWSEVRYPSNTSIPLEQSQMSSWNYARKISESDLSTINKSSSGGKTLSDYVKAIFDSMKSAEEDTEAGSIDLQRMEPKVATNVPKTITPIESSSLDEESRKVHSMETTSVLSVNEQTDRPEVTSMYPDETVGTTLTPLMKQETESPSTILDSLASSTSSSDLNSSKSSLNSTVNTATTTPTTTTSTTSTTTMASPAFFTAGTPSISHSNTTESILGKILRTSTTTKVSHMTEICYRGRCVMTKPKREIRTR